MKKNTPLLKLHVRLLKPGIRHFDEILEKDAVVNTYRIKRGFGFNGSLYVSPPNQTPPSWLAFVQSGIKEPLQELANRTNAAVLVFRRGERMLAFTFGHGRNLIRSSVLVPDFGLKTALNSLQHNNLRSLDSFAIEEQTVHTRTQASRAGGIEVFGIDIGKDILRAVTGTPRVDVPFNSVSGVESTLAISVHTDFSGLGRLCDDLLSLYRKRTYKDHFAWVDNVRKVTDQSVLDELHTRLMAEIKLGANGATRLSPPEPVDWEDIQGFAYTHRRRVLDLEPRIESYLENIDIAHLTIEDLKKNKVFVLKDDDTEPAYRWSVYSCLTFEITLAGKNYLLTTGDWFEVDRDFAKSIDKTLESIPIAKTHLPKLLVDRNGKHETEGEYNSRAAKLDPSIALLDKRLARCRSTSSGIEPCDLFTRNKEFIHVKHKKGGSSDLSHLFAQGRISAEALLGDEDFRRDVRDLLAKANLILQDAITIAKPTPTDYGVVFAILGTKNSQPCKELPFFSKLNLARTYEDLITLGFNVAVLGISKEK